MSSRVEDESVTGNFLRVLVVVTVALVMVPAGVGALAIESRMPAERDKGEAKLTAAKLKKLDYASANVTAADLEGTAAVTRAGAIQEDADVRTDLSGGSYGLRGACGEEAPTQRTVAGQLVQYSEPSSQFLFQTSIEGFKGKDADRAFRKQRQIMNNCNHPFVQSNSNDVLEPQRSGYAPKLPKGMSLIQLRFAEPGPNIAVHDVELHRGQFIYSIRIVNDSDAPSALTEAEGHGILDAGVAQFNEFLKSVR